jgi:hypothetical protein
MVFLLFLSPLTLPQILLSGHRLRCACAGLNPSLLSNAYSCLDPSVSYEAHNLETIRKQHAEKHMQPT